MLKLSKLLPDGRRQITGFLTPGDYLGLAFAERYVYSAEAVMPVRICRFPPVAGPANDRALVGIGIRFMPSACRAARPKTRLSRDPSLGHHQIGGVGGRGPAADKIRY